MYVVYSAFSKFEVEKNKITILLNFELEYFKNFFYKSLVL